MCKCRARLVQLAAQQKLHEDDRATFSTRLAALAKTRAIDPKLLAQYEREAAEATGRVLAGASAGTSPAAAGEAPQSSEVPAKVKDLRMPPPSVPPRPAPPVPPAQDSKPTNSTVPVPPPLGPPPVLPPVSSRPPEDPGRVSEARDNSGSTPSQETGSPSSRH